MKPLIVAITLLYSITCTGQCKNDTRLDTSIFSKTLNNKTDIIYFKAKFNTLGKIPQIRLMQKLIDKGFVNEKEYRTAIDFTPEGINSLYYLPYKDTNKTMLRLLYTKQNQGQIIRIRGIVIRGFEKFNGKPFFLVDKIWIKPINQ